MADAPPRLITLEDEVEGDRDASDDFVFCRIGEPVPLKPSDSKFDHQDPLCRPLAVSERFRALFLAHTEGFLVAKTKDVIDLAKEIKENGKGPSINNSTLVDVKVGRVSILALSNDSSVLAAAVGGEIHFFFVPSLLNKDQKPSFSCSLKKSGIVKDFRWQKNAQKSFVVLSKDGSLYHGRIKDNLEDVLKNVDAVDWSVEGDLVAVARKNTLSIFSSDFKEQYCISPLFRSWSTDVQSESYIKVDSIEWVRKDSIIVGCVRFDEDNNEEGYLVQVITSGEDNFSETVVFSFPDLFEGMLDDILPTGAGPYLLLSYIERWGVLLASNRKNIDQHVLLLKYSINDNKKEVSSLEFKSDKYRPTIALQENGDDNLVWGFGIDKVSVYEKVKIQLDLELRELSPCCVLFCLTSDGRLFMYHVARMSDPSDLPKSSLLSSDISLENELYEANLRPKDDTDGLLSNDIVEQISSEAPAVHTGQELKSSEKKDTHEAVGANIIPSKEDKSSGNSILRPFMLEPANAIQSPRDGINAQGSGAASERRSSTQEVNVSFATSVESTISPFGEVSNQASMGNQIIAKSISNSSDAGKKVLSPRSGETFSLLSQTTGKFYGSDGFNLKPSPFTSGGTVLGAQGKFEVGSRSKSHLSSQNSHATELLSSSTAASSRVSTNEPSAFMFSSSNAASSEKHVTSSSRKENLAIGKSLFTKQQFMDSGRSLRTPEIFDSEPELSKQVKDMTKELDTLLSHIQKEGGFKDACTVSLQGSLLTLEEGLRNLSEASKVYKRKVEEQLVEIQELQSKMLQVSAKQVYMEGIVRQASDKQYWVIWNRQKLSPEFEQKRQLILKANQELTNQLIELEKYFNALEINRFGGSSRVSTNRRVFHASLGQPRQIQSIHSLCNTLNSQLAAAEQLSECLSKQMAFLNINNTSSKRDAIARELFESIGLSHVDSAFKSPDVKAPGRATDSVQRYSSSPAVPSKEYTKRTTSSALKCAEPESTRRRKDSLDRCWASFEPQKTTVKRTAQLDDHSFSVDQPFRTAKQAFDSQIESLSNIQQKITGTQTSFSDSLMKKTHSELYTLNKGVEEKTSKQALESQPSSLFKWAKELPKSSKILDLELHPVDDLRKSIHKSAAVAQSTSVLNSAQKTQGDFGSFDTGSTTTATGKSVSDARTRPDTQLEFPDSTSTSFKLSSDIALPNNLQIFGSKALVNKQQDLKFEEDLSNKFQGSIKNLVASPQNLPTMSSESNIPSVSPKFAVPSSNSSESTAHIGTTSKDQAIRTASIITSHPKIVESIPSILNLPTSAPTSTASLSTVSSVTATSFSAVAVGGSLSLNAKDVGNSTRAASSSTSAASSQSLSSNAWSSQNEGSPNMTSGSSSSVSTASELPFPQLNDVKLRSEATLQVLENKNTEFPFTKVESATSLLPKMEGLFGSTSQKESSLPSESSTIHANVNSQPEIWSSSVSPVNTVSVESKGFDFTLSQEDEMEEEAPDTTNVLNLGALGGFGLGSVPPSSAVKTNPFGGTFVTANTISTSSPVSLTTSAGQLFRPPSFSLPSSQPMQPSQSINPNAFSGGSSGGFIGFGQPAQVGAGQQALGSVLGAFGQSRQLGTGGFGVPAAASSGGLASAGGFAGAATGGGFTSFAARPSGFAGAATVGGFAALPSAGGFGASSSGGFASAATGGGFGASSSGGFASAATGGGFGASSGSGFAGAAGGFGAVASGGGGFAAAASQGAGFGGLTGGGFGAFSGNQGSAFSAFGGNSGTGSARPPAELFTQMRK